MAASVLRVTSMLAAGASILTFVLVAVVHIADNHHVDHVAGAWMGLAAYADDGVLYPPLHAEGTFGGTRYGPTGIAINTAAAQLSGEYLVSGKVVALVLMLALLAGMYVLARRLGAEAFVAFAAGGAMIATFTGHFAGTTIYGDLLAVVLQVWAVAIVVRRTDARGTAVAGALAGLAVTAKSSAVWGAAAVFVWLVLVRRRQVKAFVVAGVVTVAAVFGAAAVLSRGRIVDNVLGLGRSGSSDFGSQLVDAPSKAWELMLHNAEATLLLLPAALVGVGLAVTGRNLEIVHLGLATAGVVTLVVLADVGTGFNHLLDLAVLVPLAVAVTHARTSASVLRSALVAVFIVGTSVSLFQLRTDARIAATAAVKRETPVHLRTPALAGDLAHPYFTEDPTIAVQRGDRPVALDSFMLLRILEDDEQAERALIDRFEQKEFTTVVLFVDLDLRDPWWRHSHLGLDVARAIDSNYRLVRKVQGPVFAYRVFEPRPR